MLVFFWVALFAQGFPVESPQPDSNIFLRFLKFLENLESTWVQYLSFSRPWECLSFVLCQVLKKCWNFSDVEHGYTFHWIICHNCLDQVQLCSLPTSSVRKNWQRYFLSVFKVAWCSWNNKVLPQKVFDFILREVCKPCAPVFRCFSFGMFSLSVDMYLLTKWIVWCILCWREVAFLMGKS